MRTHITRTFGLAAAALLLAASAQAQGRGQGRGKGAEKEKDKDRTEVRRSDGAVVRRDDRDQQGNGRRIPPGLAKKPGQMPPGQYKKHYATSEGADVLSGILRDRGYSVLRVVPSGDARYVYYRTANGTERRAIVRQGTDRLRFSNVPTSLLQEVLSRLY